MGARRSTGKQGARALSGHATKNRRDWERTAEWFEDRHHPLLARHGGMGWGLFHVPEQELRLLGEVRGKDVLELGCGAAIWSIALARRGARAVGLDLSPRRLDQARGHQARTGVHFPLIEASAESVPLPDLSFDLVFCDFGAMTFADPYRTVPEAARLLRVGGRLVFSTSSPIRMLCEGWTDGRLGMRLRHDYYGMHRIDFPTSVEFQLPYGEWFRLFHENGFEVERLEELRPPARAHSSFLNSKEERWARRWPIEMVWSVRKRAPTTRRRVTRARTARSPRATGGRRRD